MADTTGVFYASHLAFLATAADRHNIHVVSRADFGVLSLVSVLSSSMDGNEAFTWVSDSRV